ncbi:MAG: copper resistance protein CopC [Micromonosporaceae bacterium]|nr:copper resistance protein CopC [Micromonosporaceae bacterium]
MTSSRPVNRRHPLLRDTSVLSDDRPPIIDGPGPGVRRRAAWRRRLARAALATVIGLLVATGPASPAHAHAVLESTSPEADSLIQEPPAQVVLTFSEPVSPVADRVRVIAPDGRRVDRNEPRPSGQQLIIPIETLTQPGTYLVSFRVISADSHPVYGTFSFSFKQVSPGGPPQAADVAPTGFVVAALPVARWIGYAGLVLFVGAALVLTLLWPRRLDRRGPLRVARIGAGLVALGTVLALALQVPYIAGGGLGDVTGSDVREVLSSQYGAAHLVRLGVLGAALVLVQAVAKGRAWSADKTLLGVLGAIGVGTWSVAGHAAATPVPTVSIAADMVHLAAMSIWLGGLVMLALFLLPRGTASELAAIVPVWSRWATYAVGALVLTGVAQSLLEVNPLSTLFRTTYGWVLVAKVALVGVVLAVAFVSRQTVPRIAGAPVAEASEAEPPEDELQDEEAPAEEAPAEEHPGGDGAAVRRLRTLVLAEAAIALVIIAVTSVLVQLTPARTAAAPEEPGGVRSVVLRESTFTLDLVLDPGRVGVNQLHLFALTPDGRPRTVVEWRIVASQPSTGIEGVEAAVLPITDNHAIGTIDLRSAGAWTFRFELRFDEFTNGIVETTLTVST